ncbi:MAG: hypothetical protein AAF586_07390 [Planctomycetota bacterium]
MDGNQLQAEINKRLTLNLLIQGVGEYHILEGYQPVARELKRTRFGLYSLFRLFGDVLSLMQWQLEHFAFTGPPRRFWSRTHRPDHLFHAFPLLRVHGAQLNAEARRYVGRRCLRWGVPGLPGVYHVISTVLLVVIALAECGVRRRLEELAILAAHRVWSIEPDRLNGEIAMACQVGTPPVARNAFEQLMLAGAAGWCTVSRLDDGRLGVEAKAWTWNLLVHELVKGCAELICLHGMSSMDDDTYERVIQATDRIEYEPWMLQTGLSLWRRFLDVMHPAHTAADYLTHVAELPPDELEALVFALVEDPPKARRILGDLMDVYVEPEPWVAPDA